MALLNYSLDSEHQQPTSNTVCPELSDSEENVRQLIMMQETCAITKEPISGISRRVHPQRNA